MLRSLAWLFIRVVITLICCITTQNVIHQVGLFVELHYIIIIVAMLILMIKLWAPNK